MVKSYFEMVEPGFDIMIPIDGFELKIYVESHEIPIENSSIESSVERSARYEPCGLPQMYAQQLPGQHQPFAVFLVIFVIKSWIYATNTWGLEI